MAKFRMKIEEASHSRISDNKSIIVAKSISGYKSFKSKVNRKSPASILKILKRFTRRKIDRREDYRKIHIPYFADRANFQERRTWRMPALEGNPSVCARRHRDMYLEIDIFPAQQNFRYSSATCPADPPTYPRMHRSEVKPDGGELKKSALHRPRCIIECEKYPSCARGRGQLIKNWSADAHESGASLAEFTRRTKIHWAALNRYWRISAHGKPRGTCTRWRRGLFSSCRADARPCTLRLARSGRSICLAFARPIRRREEGSVRDERSATGPMIRPTERVRVREREREREREGGEGGGRGRDSKREM